MTNDQIITHFTSGLTRDTDTTRGKALKVVNGKLYSYNLLIAEYVVEEGFQGIIVHDHWAKGLGFISSTTSQHVSLILRETKHFPRKVRSQQGGFNFLRDSVRI